MSVLDQKPADVKRKISKKKRGKTTAPRKKSPSGRSPRKPLVCVPCKKRFSHQRKLDLHNQTVHNIEIMYSCYDCHKSFSRSDLAEHVKHGHCRGHSEQAAAATNSEAVDKEHDTIANVNAIAGAKAEVISDDEAMAVKTAIADADTALDTTADTLDTADGELSMTSDDAQLHDELSMFCFYVVKR